MQVNATLGGGMPQLQQHIDEAAVRLGPGIDFKLAANPGARNQQAHDESGFNTLSVKMCKVGMWGGGGCGACPLLAWHSQCLPGTLLASRCMPITAGTGKCPVHARCA